MRVLFLTQVLPYPLDAGPKIRAYYTLRRLSGYADVDLVSFVRASDSSAAIDHLRQYCSRVTPVPIHRSRLRDLNHWVGSLITRKPFLIARDFSKAMTRQIASIVREGPPFDVIHADQLWMAPYALLARDLSPRRPLTVLDQHNAVFQIPARLAAGRRRGLIKSALSLESKRLATYEARICSEFDHTVFVTANDLELLASEAAARGLTLRPHVIPIAVDCGQPLVYESVRRRITFLGGLHWPPNAEGVDWFLDQIWPQVRSRCRDACFTVVGSASSNARLRKCEDRVDFTGHLADCRPHLQETAVFVVPLLSGGGMRVKILNAWASGLPVVSTHIGAEGLRAVDGQNIFLADEPAEFAERVCLAYDSPGLRQRIASGGRETVHQSYDWRRSYAAWDEVYRCAFSMSHPTHQA